MNMRLAGQGDAGEKGGPNGHMYVHVKVADDPFFQRKGSDVYIDVSRTCLFFCGVRHRMALLINRDAGTNHCGSSYFGCYHQHPDVER